MFQLMNKLHNEIDGTYCYGMLVYEGIDYGSRGQICIYRCSQCGTVIRHLEEDYSYRQSSSGTQSPRSTRGNNPCDNFDFGFNNW